ncbi:Pentatricopeptide repeat-containing protein [Arachis hypogaea]|nr:Pentatricopeptide repeat-containing protein [Arachis hypogaea]
MMEDGNKAIPNSVTFLSLLSACAHSGLVEEGKKCFNSLKEKYGLEPDPEHYACFVDILRQASNMEEVWSAYQNMIEQGTKPTVGVWIALLNACSLNQDVERGEFAAKHLLQMEPDNASHIVLVSNFYAAIGKWDYVDELRSMMRTKGLVKEAGNSWINVKAANKLLKTIPQDGVGKKVDGVPVYTPYFFDKGVLDNILEEAVDQHFHTLIQTRHLQRRRDVVDDNLAAEVIEEMNDSLGDPPEVQEVLDEMGHPSIPLSVISKAAELHFHYTVDKEKVESSRKGVHKEDSGLSPFLPKVTMIGLSTEEANQMSKPSLKNQMENLTKELEKSELDNVSGSGSSEGNVEDRDPLL